MNGTDPRQHLCVGQPRALTARTRHISSKVEPVRCPSIQAYLTGCPLHSPPSLFSEISFSRFSRTFSARSRDHFICSGVTTVAPAPWSLPACRSRFDPVPSCVFDQPQLLGLRSGCQPIVDSLDRQFLELNRILLLRYLHCLPFHGDGDYTSPGEDEISGEAQLGASFCNVGGVSITLWMMWEAWVKGAIQRRSIWCRSLSCLSRSSNHTYRND